MSRDLVIINIASYLYMSGFGSSRAACKNIAEGIVAMLEGYGIVFEDLEQKS